MPTVLSKEETNFLRIANLLYRVAPSAVRVKFNIEFAPSKLRSVLSQNTLEPLKKKRVINQAQWDLLFPRTGTVSSDNFDLTLMLCLMRNIAKIPIGDVLPFHTDDTNGADLTRLKYYRNLVVHCDDGVLTDTQFERYWQDFTQAICRLGGASYTQTCNDLKVSKLDSNDREIITELRIMKISNDPIPKGLNSIFLQITKHWKDDDQQVVETRAMLYLRQMLQTENVVTVIGVSGCGKSTTVQHEALHLQKKQGYNIIPISSPGELSQYYNPECKQLFVIDNVCGSYSIDLHLVQGWKRESPTIMSILEQNTVKIVVVSRSHIYQNRYFKNVNILSLKTCDISSDNISLTKAERILIASAHLTEDEVVQLKDGDLYTQYEFFPWLCKIYASIKTNNIRAFFKFPVEAIKADLLEFKNAFDQVTYATLALFVIYNNCIPESILHQKTSIKSVMEHISEECEMQSTFSIQVLKSQLNCLQGSYVKIRGNAYSIIDDKYFDVIVSFYGSHMFNLILEHCHADIIRDRFQFLSLEVVNDKCLIEVSPDNENVYFNRLGQDIKNGNITNVFMNCQMQYSIFREEFIAYIRKTEEIKTFIAAKSNSELSPLLTVSDQGYFDFVHVLTTELGVNVNVRDKLHRTPLLLAASKGQTQCVKRLLQVKANTNYCDNYNRSPLLMAISDGYTDVVKLLLEHGSDVESEDKDGVTPLSLASQQGLTDIVSLLLEHNCNPNNCRPYTNPPLHIALDEGHTDIAITLLNNNSDPNMTGLRKTPLLYIVARRKNSEVMTILRKKYEISNDNISSSLDKAITKGEIDTLNFLMDHQCYPQPGDRLALLGIAARTGKVNIVQLLLQHKFHETTNNEHALPNATLPSSWRMNCIKTTSSHQGYNETSSVYSASSGGTMASEVMWYRKKNNKTTFTNERWYFPLHIASENGHKEVVQILLQHKFNPDMLNRHGYSALHLASLYGHLEVAKLLLEYECYPDFCTKSNVSPLYIASRYGHTEIAKLLLKYKCNSDLCNKGDQSPLYIASRVGNTAIVNLLLKHKCNPDLCNKGHQSPLYIASREGNTDIVNLLLVHRCNPDLCNKDNESPLYIASRGGNIRIVKLLRRHKCNQDLRNKDNESPLYIASREGHIDIVNLLLVHRCNPHLCNIDNESPLYIASREGHIKVVELLLEHTCNPYLRNKDNESPLHIASHEGNVKVVELLLEHKYNPDMCNKDNESPLYIASREGNTEIVELLLEHKCNQDMCNKDDESPLYIASREGNIKIVESLLEHKCNQDLCNKYNESLCI